jgi:hypothetical protein
LEWIPLGEVLYTVLAVYIDWSWSLLVHGKLFIFQIYTVFKPILAERAKLHKLYSQDEMSNFDMALEKYFINFANYKIFDRFVEIV